MDFYQFSHSFFLSLCQCDFPGRIMGKSYPFPQEPPNASSRKQKLTSFDSDVGVGTTRGQKKEEPRERNVMGNYRGKIGGRFLPSKLPTFFKLLCYESPRGCPPHAVNWRDLPFWSVYISEWWWRGREKIFGDRGNHPHGGYNVSKVKHDLTW